MKTNPRVPKGTRYGTLWEKVFFIVAVSIAIVGGVLPAEAANTAYLSVYTNGDFGTIDLDTGAFTLLGNSGQTIAGLGVVNGTLYATIYQGPNGDKLYTVNPANGNLTLVGASGVFYDMFGSTTTGLYAIGSDAKLYAINPATGGATLIGLTGIGLGGWRNMSVNSDTLYLALGANLYTVNTNTGAATLVGNMGGPQMGAMLFQGGVLYGGEETPALKVASINPATGLATPGPALTGVTSGVFGGLAPYPLNAVPTTVDRIFVTSTFNGGVNNTIREHDIDTGAVVNESFVSGLNNPSAIAVADSYIYVVNHGANTIGKYTLTGDTVNATLVTGLDDSYGIAAANGKLYVTSADVTNSVVSVYDAATGAVINAALVTGLRGAYGIAVSGGNIYVANESNGTIGEYDAATGAAVNASLVTGLNEPEGIAVADGNIYVTNFAAGGTNGTIGKYDASSGAVVNAALVTGLSSPFSVAVWSGKLFVANSGTTATNGSIGEYDAATGAAINAALVTGLNAPQGIAVASVPISTGTLKIVSITHPAPNTIHLSGMGVPSAVNRIEVSPDLSPNGWTTLTTITTDATGAIEYDDMNATGTRKFYRLAYP